MSAAPLVTVLCATLNAREAVRLTFASFHRFTPEPCRVLVADNGSIDGTLADLQALPWLTVIPLEERRAAAERDGLDPAGPDFTEHGATLDWLAAHVETPYFLTLDADVEFLAPGWLSAMLDLAQRERLDALGLYEPGIGSYRPRLAPYVLLFATATFRSLATSFRGYTRIDDPEEARRWRSRPRSQELSPEEAATYRTAAFYSTAAALFERLTHHGSCWSDLPPAIAAGFLHLGHMSWAAGEPSQQNDHAARLTYVRSRLRSYDLPPLSKCRVPRAEC
jgi:glycosyltransferase involved in cell wall biosynthesis